MYSFSSLLVSFSCWLLVIYIYILVKIQLLTKWSFIEILINRNFRKSSKCNKKQHWFSYKTVISVDSKSEISILHCKFISQTWCCEFDGYNFANIALYKKEFYLSAILFCCKYFMYFFTYLSHIPIYFAFHMYTLLRECYIIFANFCESCFVFTCMCLLFVLTLLTNDKWINLQKSSFKF